MGRVKWKGWGGEMERVHDMDGMGQEVKERRWRSGEEVKIKECVSIEGNFVLCTLSCVCCVQVHRGQ